jgi:hypothetical protein
MATAFKMQIFKSNLMRFDIFEFQHKISDKLFQSLYLLTNEFFVAYIISTPTRRVRSCYEHFSSHFHINISFTHFENFCFHIEWR